MSEKQGAKPVPKAEPMRQSKPFASAVLNMALGLKEMVENLKAGPAALGRTKTEPFHGPAVEASKESCLLFFQLREVC